MIEFSEEQKIKHDLVNVISNNYAMAMLKNKKTVNAIKDSRTAIRDALNNNKISKEIYNSLAKSIDQIFEYME
jgi:hypothetical protein